MPIPASDLPSDRAEYGSSTSCAAPDETGDLFTGSLSTVFREAVDLLKLYARQPEPIVIEGESGTGKTQFARLVHAWSPRAERKFEWLSLANVPEGLTSAALFGQVSGAYTHGNYARAGSFLLANNSTLFLDELGHASREAQGQLLEVIETGRLRQLGSDKDIRVDVRVVFATSVSLRDLVEAGDLLRDLYARVRMLTVRLPPLRERPEDIPDLARFFLAKHAASRGYGKPPIFSREVDGVLCKAEWPMNVRELEMVVKTLLIHAHPARTITVEHFKCDVLHEVLASAQRKRSRRKPEEVVRVHRALQSVSGTAKVLGINPSTVRSHLGRSGTRVADVEVPTLQVVSGDRRA